LQHGGRLRGAGDARRAMWGAAIPGAVLLGARHSQDGRGWRGTGARRTCGTAEMPVRWREEQGGRRRPGAKFARQRLRPGVSVSGACGMIGLTVLFRPAVQSHVTQTA
jgi:hypothetical protein